MLPLTPERALAQLLEAMRRELTDGDSAVGAAEVDVALGDGRHAQLVVGSGEESGKRAGKDHVAVPHGTTHGHAHLRGEVNTSRDGGMAPGSENASVLRPNCLDHVLLGDVALHVAVWVFVLEELREGGVLGVPVQNHHALVVTSELGQRHAVRLPRGNLDRNRGKNDSAAAAALRPVTWAHCSHLLPGFVAGRARHAEVAQADGRCVLLGGGGVDALAAAHDAALQLLDDAVGHVSGQGFAVPAHLILGH